MKNLKKIFVLSLILCFFLCLSAVSAENINLSDANNISTNNQVSSDIVLITETKTKAAPGDDDDFVGL